MVKKKKRNSKSTISGKHNARGTNFLLTLSLVPLVIGMILLGAWVLDLEILPEPQSQITVAIFFFLLTFTITNLLQKRWRLALGWGLLAVADIITLLLLNVAIQVLALIAGVAGLVLLGSEFYQQYKQGKKNSKS